jgi:hypothetical protein
MAEPITEGPVSTLSGDTAAITAEIGRHVHGGLPHAEADLRTAKDA